MTKGKSLDDNDATVKDAKQQVGTEHAAWSNVGGAAAAVLPTYLLSKN